MVLVCVSSRLLSSLVFSSLRATLLSRGVLPKQINSGIIAACMLCNFYSIFSPVFPSFHAYFSCINRKARKVEVMKGVRTVERPHKLYLVFYEFQISYVS